MTLAAGLPSSGLDGDPTDLAFTAYENSALALLLQRCAVGDTSALDRFYELTSQRIYTLVNRRTSSPTMADDAMVTVYTTVWKRAAEFDDWHCTALGWIATIACAATRC